MLPNPRGWAPWTFFNFLSLTPFEGALTISSTQLVNESNGVARILAEEGYTYVASGSGDGLAWAMSPVQKYCGLN